MPLTVDRVRHTVPTRQHELNHTDNTDHADHTDQEYIYLSALKELDHEAAIDDAFRGCALLENKMVKKYPITLTPTQTTHECSSYRARSATTMSSKRW